MTRRTFGITVLVALCATLSWPAFASGRLVYRLALSPPADVLKAEGDGKNAYANLVKERMLRRFKAAGVKEAELRIASPTTVMVETGWDHPRGWMEALMTAPGRVELRRVTPNAVRWLDVASTIPDGIELRGDETPNLWSARRSDLTRYVARYSVPNGYVTVFPEAGGFRSVTLGELVADERQVKSAKPQRSATGVAFLNVLWEASVGASLAASHVSEVEQVAIVLDGELVAFAAAKYFLDNAPVQVAVPEGAVADDRSQRDLWVRQVAGRLAAPLPASIVVLKE